MDRPVEIFSDLYLIRERLDLIEPRFRTRYVNLYLLLGDDAAVLIDTGSGLSNPVSQAEDIIGERELMVFNTHSHFDHCGGNRFFEEVHVHKLDYIGVSKHIDLSFLKTSSEEGARQFAAMGYRVPPCDCIVPVTGGEKYDLGGKELEVVFTPGHTPGSIVLASGNYLFTGDVVHHGSVYMPPMDKWDDYLSVLSELDSRFSNSLIFPGHEEVKLEGSVISDLSETIRAVDLENFTYDEYLDARVYECSPFTIVVESGGGD